VFLSYASQDAEAAQKICDALRAAGIEVWFDKSELRGGDVWDRQIRDQIHDCRLFIAVISAHTEARDEGYFRREWRLAVERAGDMAEDKTFLIPVAIDGTSERSARVPDSFKHVQWMRLPGGETSPTFVDRVRRLLSPEASYARAGETPVASGFPAAASSKPFAPPWRSKPVSWSIGAALAAALAYFAVHTFWLSQRIASSASTTASNRPQPTATLEKSIVVLPFVDMTEKHDQEYFADGMTEEIIDRLAKVPDLRVPARTSSFYFKGKPTTIRDIARELSVAHVLEGSVRRSGDRIRISAQLVRADNGYHMWSETYDRDLKDTFKVQDDIANAVVQALQITLMGGPLARPRGGTENLEAYQLYLRGLSASREGSVTSLLLARDYLDQAIKLDSEFGLAWFELSRVTALLTDNEVLTPRDGYESARQLAQHALQLSPDLAEAHAMLSFIHRDYDWDWAAAEVESRRALALDPTNPTALMIAAGVATTLRRSDEAQHLLQAALVRDPFFPLLIWWLGFSQYSAGRFADAEATFRRLLEIAPEYAWTRAYLAKTLIAEHQPEAALAVITQEHKDDERLIMLSIAFKAANKEAEAEQALKELVAKFANSDAYWVAMTYAHRGDNDLALEWLDRAYVQKDVTLVEIVGEPLFQGLATDPRYKAFLRKMNLPE
jgi:TolB-like protein/tetratricopeptide (TPR) repeat protein